MQLHLRSVALRLSLQNTSTYGCSLMKSPSPSWVVEVSEKIKLGGILEIGPS